MIGLRLVAVRVALVGIAAACVGHAIAVAVDRDVDSRSQLVIAIAAGALLWCGWWATTLTKQPRPGQTVGIVGVLIALVVGQAVADPDDAAALGVAVVSVVAMTAAVARIGGDRARLREQIGGVAIDVADARAAAATANESETSRRTEFDRLVHGLSSIELHARVAARQAEGGARNALESIERTAAGHLADVRRVEEPAQASGTTNSTTTALTRVVDRFVLNVDVTGRLDVRGEPQKVPATVELALIRTLQEAVSNIRRHARATTFHAEVVFGEESIDLTVVDDGVGADPAAIGDTGGLATTRRRLEVLGGTLAVETPDTGGTRLAASVPITPPGT